MARERAPAKGEDDRMLLREVEAALRSLTLVEGRPVADLRRMLKELDGGDRGGGRDSSLPSMHSDPVPGSR